VATLLRASTISGRTLDGPEPKRPSEGRSSGGIRMSGISGTYEIMTPVTTPPSTPTALRRISRRAAAVAPSATLAVDAKAKALRAAGEHVVGFGAGEPDFPTPEHIVEAAVAACRDPANHHYTPTAGLPALREAIADKTERDSGLTVSGTQVLVTNGGKQAVANAFSVLCDPGD